MAETTVQTPVGDIVIEHPEGASEADILRLAEFESDRRMARRQELEAGYLAENKLGGASESGFENFAAGFAKSLFDTGRGVKQLAVEGANLIPGVDLDEKVAELRQDADDQRALDADLMNTGSGLAGNITGFVGQSLVPGIAGGRAALSGARAAQAAGHGNLAANLARVSGGLRSFTSPASFGAAAASGAIQSGLQPVGERDSRGLNTAIGAATGVVGQGIARGLGRVARGFGDDLSRGHEEAVDILSQNGVDLDVAQRTGSQGLQRLRSSFFDNPLTANSQTRFSDEQGRQFTRAVLTTIGANADEATDDVLRTASREIGNRIDDFAARTPALYDDVLRNDLAGLEQLARRSLTRQQIAPLLRNIQDIHEGAVNGRIPGSILTRVRSQLGRLRAQPGMADIAADAENILLDALERGGGNRQGLKRALAQWRNFRIIEGAVDKGTERGISPLRLSNTVAQIRNRPLSLRGLGHAENLRLSDLAKAGRSLLPETLPNSGTFPRALAGEAVLFGGGTLGALAGGQDVGNAASIGLGAAALPMLLQRGMLSQGILGNAITGGVPGAGLLGSPAAQIIANQLPIAAQRSQQ